MFAPSGQLLMDNADVAALRIVLASAATLPFAMRGLWRDLRKFWLPLLVAGWMGNGLPAFLFTAAQTELDSSITGILNALTPLFTLLIALVAYKRRYPLINYIGIVIALVGAVLLIYGHSSGMAGAPFWAYLCVASATVGYAISVNVIRNHLHELSAIRITALAMAWVSPWCLVYLGYSGFLIDYWHSPHLQQGAPYAAVLGVVGTGVALILFNRLIQQSNAIFASSVTYLIPVVAVLWGFFDNEVIAATDILFAAVVVSGVYMVNKKPKQQIT